MLRAATTYPFVNLSHSPWKNSNAKEFASLWGPFSTNNYPASCNYLFHNEVNYRQKNENKIAACQSRMCHFSVDFSFFHDDNVCGFAFLEKVFLGKIFTALGRRRKLEMIIWVFMANFCGDHNSRRGHMHTQTRHDS